MKDRERSAGTTLHSAGQTSSAGAATLAVSEALARRLHYRMHRKPNPADR